MPLAASSDHRPRATASDLRGMRLTGRLLVALSALVGASALLAQNVAFGISTSVFVAANVAHLAGWSLWAVRTGRVAGTKVLAMIAAVVALGWIVMAWFVEGPGRYFFAALALGLATAAVAVWDAILSPDEDRRAAFEPRAPADVPRHVPGRPGGR